MKLWKNFLVLGSIVLFVGCASNRWEITTSEKRYQAMVNSNPKRAAVNRRTGEWKNTFSVLSPEGEWLFHSSNPFGHTYFNSRPEGIAGRYVGYEVKFYIGNRNIDRSRLDLEMLKTGDIDAYVSALIKETEAMYRWRQANYELAYRGDKHPAIPYGFSQKVVLVKGMTCRFYEDWNHQFRWTEELRRDSPGVDEFHLRLDCPGFYKGEFSAFGYIATIRIDKMHSLHGIEVDAESMVADFKRRVQRSLDSVQFDNEFTQEVPEKYWSMVSTGEGNFWWQKPLDVQIKECERRLGPCREILGAQEN